MEVQLILAVCLLLLQPALTEDCTHKATFIKRENELLFDGTNYENVCLKQEIDHVGEMTKCDGHFINPRCVCAYEMYTERIFDICNKTAPRKNGSLYHTNVDFCILYSFTHNGPCLNDGVLVSSSKTFAMDAKCRCKEGFSGDFCDTVSRPIVCTESKAGSPKDSRDCGKKFTAYPSHSSCSLTIGNRHFICDTQKNVTDGTLDCSSTDYIPPSKVQGENDEANGKSPLSGSPMLLVCLVVLILTCRLDYGDVFLELNV